MRRQHSDTDSAQPLQLQTRQLTVAPLDSWSAPASQRRRQRRAQNRLCELLPRRLLLTRRRQLPILLVLLDRQQAPTGARQPQPLLCQVWHVAGAHKAHSNCTQRQRCSSSSSSRGPMALQVLHGPWGCLQRSCWYKASCLCPSPHRSSSNSRNTTCC